MLYSIKAEIRDQIGKSANRSLRRNGLVPAILYGRGTQPINLVINEKEFLRLLEEIKGRSPIIELELAKEKVKCVIKLIQRHPISLQLLHIDFQKVKAQEKISVAVPVILSGVANSVGIKAGGILEHHLREIPLKAEVDKIPEHIEIDVSNLKLGHSIHIADLSALGGLSEVEFTLPADTTIVSILAPRKVEEVVAPVAAEEVKEPEVITEKKKGEEPSEEDKEKKAASEKEATAKKEKK